jgi:hypothetical protein
MTTRKYSSKAQQTTLSSPINATVTSMTVGNGSALMGGKTLTSTETYTVVIDPDTALEEIVDVTVYASGNTLTITRGVDSASPGTGSSHSAGAVVRHMAIGRDYQEANDHSESTTGHGATGAVVGTTNTQVLTNKDLSSATNTLSASVVTLTGSQTLTNKILTSPTVNGGTVDSAAVTGLSAPSAGGDATNKTYVDSILGSATSAASSASAAADSETAAAASASSATSSASSATSSASTATTQATNASNSATAASTSASNAATSETNAAADAATATTQASNASTSASNAASSASAAASSASAASNSATAASGSATSASNSYTAIVDQTGRGLVRDMGDITTADTTTDTYIGISTQVTNATTQATNAANSATAASNSATTASTQATNAANSATAAASSATDAAASYDSFDDRYLGAKASAPSVDNDGNALLTGALYFNSTTPGMYVWTGSAWSVMATSGDIESVTAGTGLSGGGTIGAVTVSLDTSSVYVVPSQSGNNGKFLTTDGSAASWVSISDWGTLV